MSNELKHGTVGTELTQAEWEGIGTHVLDSQATGDIVYASSSSQLRRLAKGTDTHVLILSSGIPAWSATTGITAVGTIATGVWQGTDVGVAYGGTGVSTLTANGVLVGNGSSAIGSVDMSTKGHVLIGDGTGNPQMLGVGTDTHVLTADSGETTGIKWAAPAAAAAGSLTGSTLASGVTASSLTSLGAQAEALDMSSQSVTAIGNSGSQLVADAWTMTSANTQVLSIKTSATDTAVLVTLGVGASSTGGYGTLETEYIQGGGTGAANNMGYAQGYNSSAGYFYMRSRDIDGSSGDGDVWRIVDGGDDIRFLGGTTTDGVMSVDDSTNATSGTTGSIHTDGGLGVAGDIWCTGTVRARREASGGNTILQSHNESSDANSHALVSASATSTSGDAIMAWGNAATDWAAGNDNSNSDAWVIGPSGALGGNDALRITAATPPVTSYNTTHPTGTFDYVCDVCGKHRAETFTCHDQVAQWHDDVLALMAVAEDAGKGNRLTGLEPGVKHLAKLGVLDISTNNDGSPWIGMNAVSAQWYAYSGIVQNRMLIDAQYAEIDKRLKLAGV